MGFLDDLTRYARLSNWQIEYVGTVLCESGRDSRERDMKEVVVTSSLYLDADEAVHLELPVHDVVVVGHGRNHPRHQRHLRPRLPYLQGTGPITTSETDRFI